MEGPINEFGSSISHSIHARIRIPSLLLLCYCTGRTGSDKHPGETCATRISEESRWRGKSSMIQPTRSMHPLGTRSPYQNTTRPKAHATSVLTVWRTKLSSCRTVTTSISQPNGKRGATPRQPSTRDTRQTFCLLLLAHGCNVNNIANAFRQCQASIIASLQKRYS